MYTSAWQRHSPSEFSVLWKPPMERLGSGVRVSPLPSVSQMLERSRNFANGSIPLSGSSRNTSISTITATTSISIATLLSAATPLCTSTLSSSTSPSPAGFAHKRNMARFQVEPAPVRVQKKRGRKRKANAVCTQCSLTQTPEWRRGPNGSRTLCNACGLFFVKLSNKFGGKDAARIFRYKKENNEVQDRVVPSAKQKALYCG